MAERNNTMTFVLAWFFAAAGIASLPVNGWAGAWPREKNEIYSKLGVSYFDSDEMFGPKGNRKIPGPDYSEIQTSAYVEYGFTENVTGILSFAHKSVKSSSSAVTVNNSGLSDAWISVKRRLFRAPFVLSAQAGVKFPTGYDENNRPPLGDGQLDYEGRLLAGAPLSFLSGYAGGELAYRKRCGDYSDEVPFRLEAGVFPIRRTMFKLALEGVGNLGNDRASDIDSDPNDNVFDETYLKLSPAVIYFAPSGIGFEISYEAVLAGGNTAAGHSIGIGVSYQGLMGKR